MARIGYVRVSTDDQETIRQDMLMIDQGILEEDIFREKISGKTMNRPQLQKMLDYIRKGDVVVVESISRLARNTRDLLDIVGQIKGKGADFVSLKESIDTDSPTGQFMLTVFGAIAQLERDYIRQRQEEGIRIKKEQDRQLKEKGLLAQTYRGREPIKVDREKLIREYHLVKEGRQTHEQAARILGLQIRTYYRRIKNLENDSIR